MDKLMFAGMKTHHIDGVLEIEKQSFRVPWTRISFENELILNRSAHYIVALIGRKVVGYGGYWKIIDEAHITNVAVHPDFRRMHIATGILDTMTKMAKEDGIRYMTLEVRVSNDAARTLYEKEGFVSAGIRPEYYTDNNEDAYIMWKNDI